jgi:hypothetical protein
MIPIAPTMVLPMARATANSQDPDTARPAREKNPLAGLCFRAPRFMHWYPLHR